MARKQVPVVGVNRFALTPDETPVAGDTVNNMYMLNDGATYLRMVSSSGSSQTVTVLIPNGSDTNLTVGPRVYTVLANQSSRTGFFPVNRYGSQLLFSVSSASVTFQAYSFAD